MKKFIFLKLILIMSTFVYSAFYYVPEFGDVLGVGGCGAVSTDSQSIFYNPAGLAGVSKNPEAFFSYNKHLVTEGIDINIYHLGFAYPVKFGFITNKRVGGRYKRYIVPVKFTFGVGSYGLDVNDGLYKENVYILSFAVRNDFRIGRFKQYLLTGINLKFLSLSYGKDDYTQIDPVFNSGYSKYSYTADLGFIYGFAKNLNFGLSLLNIIPTDVGLKDKEDLKLATSFAVRYRIYNTEILTEVKLRDKFEDFAVGIRQNLLNNNLKLSLGVNTTQVNFALGYKFLISKNFIIQPTYTLSYPYYMSTSGTHNIVIKIKW